MPFHRNDAIVEARGKYINQPALQLIAFLAFIVEFDSHANLQQSLNTKKQIVLILLVQPTNHAWMWLALGKLRDHIGIQQVSQNSMCLGSSRTRPILIPEPRSGEFIKNSARLSFGLSVPYSAFHASIEITTATGRPFFVICCGPFFCA